MFESIKCQKCGVRADGLHYTIGRLTKGIESLKSLFPDGECNDLNFVIFSTSGVHGTYTTLDEIETSITKYGFERPKADANGDWPDDYVPREVTVLIVHPRVVALRYGCVNIETPEDFEYLKKLRASGLAVVSKIGLSE